MQEVNTIKYIVLSIVFLIYPGLSTHPRCSLVETTCLSSVVEYEGDPHIVVLDVETNHG